MDTNKTVVALNTKPSNFYVVKEDVLKEHLYLWNKENVTGEADYKRIYYSYIRMLILDLHKAGGTYFNLFDRDVKDLVQKFFRCHGMKLDIPDIPTINNRQIGKSYKIGGIHNNFLNDFNDYVISMSDCTEVEDLEHHSPVNGGIGRRKIESTLKIYI